jgi:acyl-CoA synthetase (AMP-forming)/AMP-acid ligase II
MEVFVVDRLKVDRQFTQVLVVASSDRLLQEIIKVRGFQVAPAELEGHLLMHPDVADACVVSIPDEYSGELPLAYIVIHDKALQRIAGDKTATLKLKAALAKVPLVIFTF